MAATAIWWDAAKNAYVCIATASVATAVAAYAADKSNGGPDLGLGTQLLNMEDGYLYLWNNAAFQKFGV